MEVTMSQLYTPTEEEIERAIALLKFNELMTYKVRHILTQKLLEYNTKSESWVAVSSRDETKLYSLANGECTCPARAKSPTIRCKHLEAFRAYHSIMLRQLNDRIIGVFRGSNSTHDARAYWNAALLVDKQKVVAYPEQADRIPTTICATRLANRNCYKFKTNLALFHFAYWLGQARDLTQAMQSVTKSDTLYSYYIKGPLSDTPEPPALQPIFEADEYHEEQEFEIENW